jgi:FkbM family methyltransferase
MGQHRWVKARCFWGDPIYVLTGEIVSKGVLAFGYGELALSALMIEFLRPGMRFVDVGAHIGYEAMLASVLVGRQGAVISFEPQEQIIQWTRTNLRKFPQARLVQAAAGEANTKGRFTELEITDSAFSGQQNFIGDRSGRKYMVEMTTIDTALRPAERPVDFIKCDAEGAEMTVLRGALDVLAQDRPLLVLEAEMPCAQKPRPRVREFSEFLAPLGYRGFSFDYDGSLRVGALGSFREGHANVAFVHTSRMGLVSGIRSD